MSAPVTHERTYRRTIDGREYDLTLTLTGDFLGDEGPREVPALTGVRVEYVGSPRKYLPSVTGTVLRKIPLKALEREMARDIIADRDERPSYVEALRALRNSGPTPEALRLAAEIYTDAHLSGQYPLKAVSEKMHMSQSTASRWAEKCRALGYLTVPKGAR